MAFALAQNESAAQNEAIRIRNQIKLPVTHIFFSLKCNLLTLFV